MEFDEPIKYHTTINLSDSPITPHLLEQEVVKRLLSFNNGVVAKDTGIMVQELCRGFNHCIELNSNKSLESETLIFSPKTGSAKSLTSKVYLSLLPSTYKSLMVVLRVSDAISFCEDINNWSKDKDKARCIFSVKNENSDNPLRISLDDIDKYDTIIITHSMYKIICSSEDLNIQRRDLIIVDERIDMSEKYEISEPQIVSLVNTLEGINNYLQAPFNFDDTIEYLQSLWQNFQFLNQNAVLNNIDTLFIEYIKNTVSFMDNFSSEDNHTILLRDNGSICKKSIKFPKNESYSFTLMLNLLKQNKRYLVKFASPLASTKVREDEIIATIERITENIQKLQHNSFYYHRSGSIGTIIIHKDIPRKMGSNVLLDATAEVNEKYNDLLFNNTSYKLYTTTDPRNYRNLKIHVAHGFNQGKSSIYGQLNEIQIVSEANRYLQLANTLLGENDKMLIITFLEFKSYLQNNNSNDNIVFTHWGNHIGKNDWNDCNKVLIIGWNYLPAIVHRANFYDATQTIYTAIDQFGTDSNNAYSESMLADDLVQASMRGSARNVIDELGNCNHCDIYLFCPKNQFAQRVINYYTSQFKDATVDSYWNPTFSDTGSSVQSIINTKKTNEDLVIDYLAKYSFSDGSLECKFCREALSLNESSFSKVLGKVKMRNYLHANNIIIDKVGKSKYFIKRQ